MPVKLSLLFGEKCSLVPQTALTRGFCFPGDVTCGFVIKILVIIFYRFHVNCLQVMLLRVPYLS